MNAQLSFSLPVKQDMVELASPELWERMKEEYGVLSLYPDGHIMAKLRPRLGSRMQCSRDIPGLRDGVQGGDGRTGDPAAEAAPQGGLHHAGRRVRTYPG